MYICTIIFGRYDYGDIYFFLKLLCVPEFLQWAYSIYKQNIHQTAFKFFWFFTWKKTQIDVILMWLWDSLNLLINSLKGDIIIQLDYLNPYELSSVIMLVSQNMDIKSLCDPVLRGYPVCEKSTGPGVLGLITLGKAF